MAPRLESVGPLAAVMPRRKNYSFVVRDVIIVRHILTAVISRTVYSARYGMPDGGQVRRTSDVRRRRLRGVAEWPVITH